MDSFNTLQPSLIPKYNREIATLKYTGLINCCKGLRLYVNNTVEILYELLNFKKFLFFIEFTLIMAISLFMTAK